MPSQISEGALGCVIVGKRDTSLPRHLPPLRILAESHRDGRGKVRDFVRWGGYPLIPAVMAYFFRFLHLFFERVINRFVSRFYERKPRFDGSISDPAVPVRHRGENLNGLEYIQRKHLQRKNLLSSSLLYRTDALHFIVFG